MIKLSKFYLMHLNSHIEEYATPQQFERPSDTIKSSLSALSVPITEFLERCEYAKEKLGSPIFSLKVSSSTMLPCHGILGFLLKSCDNIGEVIKYGYKFQNLSRSGFFSSISYGATDVTSTLECNHINPEVIAPFVEYCHGNLFAIASELTGLDKEIVAKEVHFRHKPRASLEHYRQYINANSILFSQPENKVVFSRRLMKYPLYISDNSMKDVFLREAHRISNNLCEQQPTKMAVSQILQQQNPFALLTLNHCAEKMSISTSTLKRRLLTEKSSYQQIINDVRSEIACRFLTTSNLPIQNISHELGFSNVAAFSRAFKRWFKETPIQYRENSKRTASQV